jgi:hypothetical protein
VTIPPPPTPEDIRDATNESVHRTSNEIVEAGSDASTLWMKCECECHRADCGSSFHIKITDYEAVRTEGRQFVVTPGHQTAQETIVSTEGSYCVILKHGEQGRIATQLDPR